MKNFKKAVEYLRKYTKDFIVLEKSTVLGMGTNHTVELELEEGEVLASVVHNSRVLVFWGCCVEWFNLHGEKCAILVEHDHLGREILLVTKSNCGTSVEILTRGIGRLTHPCTDAL